MTNTYQITVSDGASFGIYEVEAADIHEACRLALDEAKDNPPSEPYDLIEPCYVTDVETVGIAGYDEVPTEFRSYDERMFADGRNLRTDGFAHVTDEVTREFLILGTTVGQMEPTVAHVLKQMNEQLVTDQQNEYISEHVLAARYVALTCAQQMWDVPSVAGVLWAARAFYSV